MLNKKIIISLAVASLITCNLNFIDVSAFAGYDDNYSYNTNKDSDGYGNYIFGIYIDEDNAVEVIQDEKPEETFTDLYYTINNNEVTITGYNENIDFTYYTIPSTISGYPVTAIGENAFKNCSSMVGLTVPNTVKTVGAYAFVGCTNLESIVFESGSGSSSDEIEDDYLGMYETAETPLNDTQEFTTTAPMYDYGLSEETTTSISQTLQDTQSNEESSNETPDLEIDHGGLTAIMEHAFDKCTNLSKISVPKTLIFIGAYAINDTQYYKSKEEKAENIILGSVFYKYFPNYTYSYEYNELITAYEPVVNDFEDSIPDGIVSISYSAFQDIEGLTTLEVPDTLKTIYDYAFANCDRLETIEFSNGIEYVGNNAFLNTPWLENSSNGYAILGDYLYKYVGKGGTATIPSKVRIIGSEAFALNSSVTRVVVPDGVKKIMGGSFYRCENLQTVVISGDVLSIGNQAFYGCKNLSMITLNEGLLSIGSKCFISCEKLKYVIIPDSVAKIGDMAFGFNYDSIHISYALIDGFTIVGSENSTAQTYAKSKNIAFSLKENFTIPKQQKIYTVDTENDDIQEQPIDTKLILKIVGSLVGLLAILSLILYIKDRKANPKKYKKKRKKKKKKSRSIKK